ncbi:uncharacterized protein LOC143286477 [Babylonia areolata]|uniref:uncharacterized protein LOC143286477 n=1 Tax=Babylonia areolata TaxID=304850 RepID=UPI003FD234B3
MEAFGNQNSGDAGQGRRLLSSIIVSNPLDIANSSCSSSPAMSGSPVLPRRSLNSANGTPVLDGRPFTSANGQLDVYRECSSRDYSGSMSFLSDMSNGSDGSERTTNINTRPFTTPVIHYVAIEKSSNSSAHVLNRDIQTSYPWNDQDLPGLLDDLRKYDSETKQAEKQKLTMNDVIPTLTRNRNFSGLAALMSVTEDHIQARVMEELQKLILDLRKSQDRTVTDDLLQVALQCRRAVTEQGMGEDNPNFLPTISLFLLAYSALRCRCPLPTNEQWEELTMIGAGGRPHSPTPHLQQGPLPLTELLSGRGGGRGGGGSGDGVGGGGGGCDELSRMVQAVLQECDEGLMDRQRPAFHKWEKANFNQDERAKRRTKFANAPFSLIVVHLYTLLNELRRREWAGTGHSELTSTLGDIHQELCSRCTKGKAREDVVTAAHYFLLDGLVTLLSSTFEEAVEQKNGNQDGNYGRQSKMTELILDIIGKAASSVQNPLLRRLESLISHRCPYVKQKVSAFFLSRKCSSDQLALCSVENSLKPVGFHGDPDYSTTEPAPQKDRNKQQCGWRTFTGTLGCQKVEVWVYCRHHECEAHMDIGKCLEEHPGSKERAGGRTRPTKLLQESSQRHLKHMDMLRQLSPRCPHVLQMHAYRNFPAPFYVTEQVQPRRLLMHVLEHRGSQRLLQEATKRRIMEHVLRGLKFFQSEGIDPRDVTTYNMVVQPGPDYFSRADRGKCSVLDPDGDFMVKFAYLGSAHRYRRSDATTDIIPVCHQGAVPWRWTSPEALFEGQYSEKNMVYSVGCVMYELWTHGCQPFSSYKYSTDELLIKMFYQPELIQLNHYQCIPDDVFRLIRNCTNHDPSLRPSLSELHVQLRELRTEDDMELSFEEDLAMWKKYPALNKDQVERGHVPETGIPMALQQLLEAGKNSKLYDNTRKSLWRPSSLHLEITKEELISVDPIDITHQETCTEVTEPLSRRFVEEVLPDLRVSRLKGVSCWWETQEEKSKLRKQDRQFVHQRKYPKTMTLFDAASRGVLFNDPEKLGVTLTSFVSTVSDCHRKSWLVRDLKARNILIDCSDYQVILARIGHMCQDSSSENCVFDERFEDSRRWLAPEVLLSGRFGPEADVFMLGTVIWELFRIREGTAKDPLATPRDFAPHANVSKDKVIEQVREGKPLPRPALCPTELWRLINDCRQVDPLKRPSAADVLQTLQQYTSNPVHRLNSPFRVDPQNILPRRRTCARRKVIAKTFKRGINTIKGVLTTPRQRRALKRQKCCAKTDQTTGVRFCDPPGEETDVKSVDCAQSQQAPKRQRDTEQRVRTTSVDTPMNGECAGVGEDRDNEDHYEPIPTCPGCAGANQQRRLETDPPLTQSHQMNGLKDIGMDECLQAGVSAESVSMKVCTGDDHHHSNTGMDATLLPEPYWHAKFPSERTDEEDIYEIPRAEETEVKRPVSSHSEHRDAHPGFPRMPDSEQNTSRKKNRKGKGFRKFLTKFWKRGNRKKQQPSPQGLFYLTPCPPPASQHQVFPQLEGPTDTSTWRRDKQGRLKRTAVMTAWPWEAGGAARKDMTDTLAPELLPRDAALSVTSSARGSSLLTNSCASTDDLDQNPSCQTPFVTEDDTIPQRVSEQNPTSPNAEDTEEFYENIETEGEEDTEEFYENIETEEEDTMSYDSEFDSYYGEDHEYANDVYQTSLYGNPSFEEMRPPSHEWNTYDRCQMFQMPPGPRRDDR